MDPVISVVVATCDRPERLRRLLAALRAQDLGGDRFEVIVVDDGLSGETSKLLDRERAAGDLSVHASRTEGRRGPARARNVGWRLAAAPLVAFTDDDCVPSSRWLTAGLARAEEFPGAIVQGPTEPDPSELGNVSVFSRTIRQAQLGPHYETCNIFYPRALLERLGGFDESFGARSEGEDTDLAWRALGSGGTSVFAPDARVLHAVEDVGPLRTLRLATRWTSCVRLLAEYPQTRVMLERGVFWNVWHYMLLRCILATFGPRWLRRVLVIRYLRAMRVRGRGLGAGLWSVPFLILHDAVETAAIIQGAVRYRTLAL
ncbi:MAG TPA: glycosyltransferase [Solirubrobacteraceae bacterium]|jgi:GT2 family glycosyltransferase